MSQRKYNVLFLCTGNSARSLMAECALDRWGQGRFQAYSAGSQPTGKPHPMAIELMNAKSHDTSKLRSKSWDEFPGPNAPRPDFVFTVCDNARGEACPIWSGRPVTAHWGVDDPAAEAGTEDAQRALFRRVYSELENRIKSFARLPIETLDRTTLQKELDRIAVAQPAD